MRRNPYDGGQGCAAQMGGFSSHISSHVSLDMGHLSGTSPRYGSGIYINCNRFVLLDPGQLFEPGGSYEFTSTRLSVTYLSRNWLISFY